MRYLPQCLAHLWSAAYNLTISQRRASVRAAGILAAVLMAAVLLLAVRVSGAQVAVDHPLWEAVLQARAVLVRLILAAPVFLFGLMGAVAAYQVIENTELGRRLMIWNPSDLDQVRAVKTRNAGSLLAALVLASVLGMTWGVLR